MPQTIFLFLATGSLQQLGFKPSLPQRPIPDLERGSKDLGSSRPVERPAKSKEGEAHGLEGRVRQDMPPLPWIDPFPAVPPTDHPSAAAVRRAELPQWGLRWGHKGVTRGFQEKGGKGRGGMWTPSPPWGAVGGRRDPDSSVSVPARTLPKSQICCSSHRLGFCVLGSGTLTPHHPTKEIHLAAQPQALPAPSEKKTSPVLRRAWPPGQHSALPGHRHHRLLLRAAAPAP